MRNTPADRELRVADLAKGRTVEFALIPEADERKAIAEALDLLDVRKVRFEGSLSPTGKADWRLQARLGATVVQPCVVTLEPVTTRIEDSVERLFLADPPPPPDGEVEMPEDDSAEELADVIDLGAILLEALSLALPPWPRAEGVELTETTFAEPGVAPMSDDDAKPFAGLASLRDSLDKKDG